MRIHTGTITITDRVALSNDLFELSESFAEEAKRWRPTARRELERNSRLLAEIGRGVLSGAADFQRAEAFADAGATTLAGTQEQRHALTARVTRRVKRGGLFA
ncbi:hypothetical protein KZC56_17555 [Microbacterium sp. SSW1-47]|uniref:hypothetical protein n=1 Tax=Microbacterium sufflavum TaxID=2851649 RepID=UPI001FFC8502|nr:hypothetical protein [Microbacterium sufflavum]MCK2028107.1 hypothetical protein [Microbacterium sufflavum]